MVRGLKTGCVFAQYYSPFYFKHLASMDFKSVTRKSNKITEKENNQKDIYPKGLSSVFEVWRTTINSYWGTEEVDVSTCKGLKEMIEERR